MAGVILLSIFLWLSWRIWSFSVAPAIWPRRLPTYPYSLPFIGHALSMMMNSEDTIVRARRHFQNRQRSFFLVIFGAKICVVVDATDIAKLYSLEPQMTNVPFVQKVMRACDVSQEAIQATFPASTSKDHPNPTAEQTQSLLQISHGLHGKFLQARPELQRLQQRMCDHLSRTLDAELLKYEKLASNGNGDNRVPLWDLISKVFVRAGQETFFGSALSKYSKHFVEDFLVFDDDSWKVLYDLPTFLSWKMQRAKRNLNRGLEGYFRLPASERSDAADLIKETEKAMRAKNLEASQIAPLILVEYWGMNTNSRKICFWLLYEITRDPRHLHTVRNEIDRLFDESGSALTPADIMQGCPFMCAAFDEAMRLYSFSTTVRAVLEPVEVSKGFDPLAFNTTIMVPYRQLHFDEEAFGPRSSAFEPERFLKFPRRARCSSYKPFGGGAALCPGRNLAKSAVVIFIANLLRRYELTIDSEVKHRPMVELRRPTLGVADLKLDRRGFSATFRSRT